MSKKQRAKETVGVESGAERGIEVSGAEATAVESGWVEVQAGAPASAESGADAAAPKKGSKRARGEVTLAQLAEKYLAHLESSGKSSGTCFSYKLELSVALDELGAETRVAELTSERVMLFFASERVTQTRTGRAKSPLSIAKTQRVLRQALVFAVSRGFIEKAPMPEDAATH